jgi:hypothetical protein
MDGYQKGYERYVKEKHKKDINTKTHCLKMTKAFYGLVQAARHWWKKFKEVLETLNYIPSRADPCLFIKKENEKRSYLIIYVDDGGIFCETSKELKELIAKLSKHFVVKDIGNMETFVGCKIINNKTNDTVYNHQPKLLKHLKQEFVGLVETLNEFSTPAPPRTMVKRPDKEDTLITLDQQTKFRSRVGMLSYLVKHTRFDIANSVRELSKVADGATMAHWKLLLRCIKTVITTRNLALKIEPN